MVLTLTRIAIKMAGIGEATAELDDRNPRIAGELMQRLPLEARANLWGDEVYFEVTWELEDENTCQDASIGDISYWSPGPAVCIFFGKTQPYSAVNHVGRVVEGIDLFRKVEEGD
jgi:hypothetical protein